jgi:nucleoside-diphosphate-sugar epimerase
MGSKLHVVFGAGQVGSGLARRLTAAGHRVRVARRSAAAVGDGIEVVAGDAKDPAFAVRAAEGAAVVYHCMNPSKYDDRTWEAEFPAMGEALIAAAVASGARLVVLDNLYGFGPVDGPRTEATPLAASGAKGRVRTAWDERLRQAAREQGLRFAVGRAGDFFGPGADANSLMSAKSLSGWGGPWLPGDPEAPHAFGFVPDVVAGLMALGTAEDDVEGRFFQFPAHTVASAELVRRIAAARGTTARWHVLTPFKREVLGYAIPVLHELRETWYQWDRPFLVDDAPFRARFPGVGATLDEAVRACAAELGAP